MRATSAGETPVVNTKARACPRIHWQTTEDAHTKAPAQPKALPSGAIITVGRCAS